MKTNADADAYIHYITLHYVTVQYVTFNYITLHFTTYAYGEAICVCVYVMFLYVYEIVRETAIVPTVHMSRL